MISRRRYGHRRRCCGATWSRAIWRKASFRLKCFPWEQRGALVEGPPETSGSKTAQPGLSLPVYNWMLNRDNNGEWSYIERFSVGFFVRGGALSIRKEPEICGEGGTE